MVHSRIVSFVPPNHRHLYAKNVNGLLLCNGYHYLEAINMAFNNDNTKLFLFTNYVYAT